MFSHTKIWDASSWGRIIQGTDCPGGRLSRGRVILGTDRLGDGSSRGHTGIVLGDGLLKKNRGGVLSQGRIGRGRFVRVPPQWLTFKYYKIIKMFVH
jgi:hypothetical protein